MISLDKIQLRYGARELYRGVSGLIGEHDRIALIGPNGAGKSTFFRLLLGEEEVDVGNINIAKHVRFGHLPQEQLVKKGKSVYDEVESVFEEIIELRKSIDDDSKQLHELPEGSKSYIAIIEKIGECEHRLEELEVHKLRSRIEKVLMGLGFRVSDMQRDTGEFSGGWQMRIALAKLLLLEPTVLLLDEPTNHLDIISQRWLENQLKSYDGAVIIISHDQAFLDVLCKRTFALGNGKLEIFEGNYSYYLRESQHRQELNIKAYESQQKKIQKTEEFIDRFRYKATKSKQVQSRIKALDKVERLVVDKNSSSVSFSFPLSRRSGKTVIKLNQIKKSFGELVLFENFDLQIERGEKIAVVGPNGCGKSTLVSILSGEVPIDSGERVEGHQADIAFFAQQQADVLDGNLDVLTTLENSVSGTYNKPINYRNVLGTFLFQGDDVYKPVKVLSGGEKSRLALAKILSSPSNLLILDEPTNHIDIQTKQVLQKALLKYEGSCVIVSHDRMFLDPIVTKVVEISHSGVRFFFGNVTEYLQKLDEEEQKGSLSKLGGEKNPDDKVGNDKLTHKERRRARAAIQAEISRHKKDLSKLEQKIESHEKRKLEMEIQMADPEFYKNMTKGTIDEHLSLENDLSNYYARWEELGNKIAEIQKKQ